jgi:hypothetical protein
MIVDRKSLLEAGSVLSKIPVQEGVPTSEQLRVEVSGGRLLLSATGGVNCQARIPVKEGSIKPVAVMRPVFVSFVEVARNLETSNPFEFEQKDSLLWVRNGKRQLKLPVKKPIGNYGCSQAGDKWRAVEEPKGLRVRVQKGLGFASTSLNDADLFCVYLSPEGVLAADRKSGICLRSAGEVQPLFVPLPFAELWAGQEGGRLYRAEKMVQFRSSRLVFEHALPAVNYFPYKKFKSLQKVPEGSVRLEFQAGSLQSVASRFQPFLPLAGEDEKVLYLKVFKDKQEAQLRMKIIGNEVKESVKLSGPARRDREFPLGASYVFKFAGAVSEKEKISMATTEDAPLFWLRGPGVLFHLAKLVT